METNYNGTSGAFHSENWLNGFYAVIDKLGIIKKTKYGYQITFLFIYKSTSLFCRNMFSFIFLMQIIQL